MARKPGTTKEYQRPSNDPAWEYETLTLLEYLSEPRSWDDLDQWSRENGLSDSGIRQALAWLDDAGKVRALYRGEKRRKNTVVWVRHAWWTRSNKNYTLIGARDYDPEDAPEDDALAHSEPLTDCLMV